MPNLLTPTLVIVRHAHRSKALGANTDNGISAKGKKQVRELTRFFKKRFGKTPAVVYSSPKKRCQQTISPIAKLAKTKVGILDCLDEADHGPSLKSKISEFEAIRRESRAELIVICSHGDWIPAYLEAKLGIPLELAKGGWAELEFYGDAARLKWLVQEFV